MDVAIHNIVTEIMILIVSQSFNHWTLSTWGNLVHANKMIDSHVAKAPIYLETANTCIQDHTTKHIHFIGWTASENAILDIPINFDTTKHSSFLQIDIITQQSLPLRILTQLSISSLEINENSYN